MPTVTKAVCWAIVILAMAVAKSMGVISSASGATMLIVLPILAVLSLRGRKGCSLAGASESAR